MIQLLNFTSCIITVTFTFLFLSDFQECKWTEVGLEYRGSINETRAGVPCADWDTVTGDIGNTSALDENFCRNPDGKPGGPWCYTPLMSWDYCTVPFCKGRLKISANTQTIFDMD